MADETDNIPRARIERSTKLLYGGVLDMTMNEARRVAHGEVLELSAMIAANPDLTSELEGLIDAWSDLDDPIHGPADG